MPCEMQLLSAYDTCRGAENTLVTKVTCDHKTTQVVKHHWIHRGITHFEIFLMLDDAICLPCNAVSSSVSALDTIIRVL